MQRRDLLARIPMVLLSIPLIGCITDEDSPLPVRGAGGGAGGAGGAPGTNDQPAPFVVANEDDSGHLHSFELTCASLEARQYTYTASGAHTHQITLTDDHIDQVLDGKRVTIQTTAGHPHTWVLQMPRDRCA